MSLSAKIRAQLINSFRAELAEHIQTLTDGLLALEQQRLTPDQEPAALEALFRAAHSLKGAARAVGVTAIEQLAHALEDVLDALQHRRLEPGPALFTACYQTLDAIQAVQAAYESGALTPPIQVLQALAALEPFQGGGRPAAAGAETAAAPGAPGSSEPVAPGTPAAPATPAAPPSGGETIRIHAGKLDALLTQLSELHVARIRAEQRLVQVHQAQETVAQWQKEWLSARESYSRLARRTRNRSNDRDTVIARDTERLLSYMESSQERLHEMSGVINHLAREYGNDTMQLSLAIDDLEEEIKRARLLPLSTITAPFARMVRDLAEAAGKAAALQILGGSVELDKRVLEQIKDPLIHLLRNAIDHGIESPDRREAAGKARTGRITLKAEQVGKDILLTIADDGRGLDLESIRRTVARRGQGNPQALSEADLAEAIFLPGISTNETISDVSGRGVGLDVVRRNVEALHGRIQVAWHSGEGTTFTLALPLALTSSRALLVRVSRQLFAIPLNAIERIIPAMHPEIISVGGHETLQYNDRPLPVVHLSDVLGLPRTASNGHDGRLTVLILASAERRMAFVVDELAGEQEVVIKGLGRQLQRVNGISGATIMGNGDVLLILNAADLIKLALHGERRSLIIMPEAPSGFNRVAPRQILIADDSITTRTLEKNILEGAGYTVWVATDGQEALSRIVENGLPDLVISDVSMPRLTGVELTRHLKADPRTARIPVILMTSLDSPEDKARGIEAGADAYLIKSHFDQDNLLDTISQLI